MAENRPSTINGEPVPYGATVEELSQQLKELGPIAWAAFEALGHTSTDEALHLLTETACSNDWRYRRCAVEAIGNHTLTSASAGVLLGALEDPNQYVVITACRAVAHQKISQARIYLLGLLTHAEPTVREAALMALSSIWQPQDFEMVKRLHIFDCSSEVRKKAAYALIDNVSARTWRDLFDLWQSSPNGKYRLWAVQLAQQFGGEETSRLLSGFQNDKDGHVRKTITQTRGLMMRCTPDDTSAAELPC